MRDLRIDDIRAAGVEHEPVRSFAVERHVEIDVVFDQIEGNLGLSRAAGDRKVVHVRVRLRELRLRIRRVDRDARDGGVPRVAVTRLGVQRIRDHDAGKAAIAAIGRRGR